MSEQETKVRRIRMHTPEGFPGAMGDFVPADDRAMAEKDATITTLRAELEAGRKDADLLVYLQSELDKPPAATVFSVYEYGTRVFALRNALRLRATIAADSAREGGEG